MPIIINFDQAIHSLLTGNLTRKQVEGILDILVADKVAKIAADVKQLHSIVPTLTACRAEILKTVQRIERQTIEVEADSKRLYTIRDILTETVRRIVEIQL